MSFKRLSIWLARRYKSSSNLRILFCLLKVRNILVELGMSKVSPSPIRKKLSVDIPNPGMLNERIVSTFIYVCSLFVCFIAALV